MILVYKMRVASSGTSEHHDELPADAEERPKEPKELGAGSCGMFMYFSIF